MSASSLFTRIREALQTPRALHHSHEPEEPSSPPEGPFQQWLPNPGENQQEWLASFRQLSGLLKTEIIELEGSELLPETLKLLARENGWKKVATQDNPIVKGSAEALDLPLLFTDTPYDPQELEQCDAGITCCEALVAQTASILVSSTSCGGRALSILPHHHVVVATHHQLVRDLSAAFDLVRNKYGDAFPSMLSFITGPSRTGDIERILVLGAHGPKKLTVILV